VRDDDNEGMSLNKSTRQISALSSSLYQRQRVAANAKGVINRQVECLILDPYANAFHKDLEKTNKKVKNKHTYQRGL
jgi:meiotically up-regulated gene 157 (Mug157) protein